MTSAEVVIERIAAGGDGIARTNDLVVFVPRSAPGDRLRVSLATRKRFARGTIDDILEPSAERIEPLCYHYRVDKCGGCQLQHMRYEAQVEAKRGIIRDSITRIGKRPIEPPELMASEKQWRYRRKLTLAMRRPAGGKWVIGLHRYDDPVAVFQLSDCPITDEHVLNIWRQMMEACSFFPKATELRASVRVLETGASIVMEGGAAWPEHQQFFDAVPGATVLWWKPENRRRELLAERGATRASASFAQVNAQIADAILDRVTGLARDHAPDFLIDAYAGSGAAAISLADGGVRVLAIESDRDAVAACSERLPNGSRAITARVEEVIASELPADVILVNPPRLGLHEHVTAALEQASPAPRSIIYTSCDPGTLARDLARLPSYEIKSLFAFDMFPQTAHVETVCELVPVEGGA